MKFNRKVNRRTNKPEMFATSECGKYRIAICIINGREKNQSYRLAGLVALGQSTYDSKEAIKFCEEDQKK